MLHVVRCRLHVEVHVAFHVAGCKTRSEKQNGYQANDLNSKIQLNLVNITKSNSKLRSGLVTVL